MVIGGVCFAGVRMIGSGLVVGYFELVCVVGALIYCRSLG
jgi:hypothetical protein